MQIEAGDEKSGVISDKLSTAEQRAQHLASELDAMAAASKVLEAQAADQAARIAALQAVKAEKV